MDALQIRAATPDDWPAIWPIFEATVAAGETYAYPVLTSDEARALWMQPPPDRTLVAEVDGRVVGTAKTGPNRPGPGDHVATASFMVDAAAGGRGVGRRLAEEVLALARDDGYHAMQFNAVVETNATAVHLWRRLGFEIVGTVPEAFRHPARGLVGLHVMYRRL